MAYQNTLLPLIVLLLLLDNVSAEGNITSNSGDIYLLPENNVIIKAGAQIINIGNSFLNFISNEPGLNSYNASYLYFGRNNNYDPNTLTPTISGQRLGGFLYQGINANSEWANSAAFIAEQDSGVAGVRVPSKMIIFTSDGSNLNERVVINKNGYVGIGTSDPGNDMLDVRGRAYASGGWQTTNADYAEWFEKEADAHPGDIIGINPKTGKARTYKIGDFFIGVYSTNPSIVGNRYMETDDEMEKNNVLVSLLGQVELNLSQATLTGRLIRTKDGKNIGILLNNGKTLIGR